MKWFIIVIFPNPDRFPGKKGTKQSHFKYNDNRLKIRQHDVRLSEIKRIRSNGFRSELYKITKNLISELRYWSYPTQYAPRKNFDVLVDVQSGASGERLGWVELNLGCSTILLGQ